MATVDPFILLNSISGKSRTAIYCIIMCHLETVKTYLMLKPISTAAQYCLLLVACNACNKHLEHLKPYPRNLGRVENC